MRVTIPFSILSNLRRKARATFPNEIFGVFLGDTSYTDVYIRDIYYPPNQKEGSFETHIEVWMDWFRDAEEYASNKGEQWIVLGDVHSHCYEEGKRNVILPQHEPSEGDWDSALDIHDSGFPSYCLFGVCRVLLSKKNRLRATLRIWPLPQPVETIIVKGKDKTED